MYTLLVLADDLTGALDTGVQFAKRGIPTQVCPGPQGPGAPDTGEGRADGTLVINTGTRHCSSGEARRVIAGILERYSAVPYVYKKTDSTLRGNIGAELEALIRARNPDVLPFIPAYPNLGRSTRQGRQYLDGVPIDKTAAASDALNPVRHSFIPDIIAEESELPVRVVSGNGFDWISGEVPGDTRDAPGGTAGQGRRCAGRPEIRVYNAESNADLQDIARGLGERKLLGTLAGCAGFAEFLVDIIPFAGPGKASPSVGSLETERRLPAAGRPALIVSGSRHPVSLAQVKAALDAGIPALAAEGDKLLRPGWLAGEEAAAIVSRGGELLRAGGPCILGTRISLGRGEAEPPRSPGAAALAHLSPGKDQEPPRGRGVAALLGELAARIFTAAGPVHLVVFGGDTLLGITEALGCRLLRPLREIRPGIVLARAETPGGSIFIAAKSGAFGEPGIIAELTGFFGGGPDAAAFTGRREA
ncbi:MAG: hypothetical protein LBB77_01545 [Treponema sp.]|jgi:uncharacterized protein YgbK (DUF1537 family)|nr:hypothetical protein [Treponema sp.]